MRRKPKPRRDRDLPHPARQEVVTYLMNAEEIGAISSHFAAHVVSMQARRVAGHFERGEREAEEQ
jgi:hypothetical protein